MQVEWYQPKVLWHFLTFVFKSFMDNEGLENAKSLTYTSLFAVVPLLTLLLTMLTAFPSFQDYAGQVQDMIFNRLVPNASSEVQNYLENFTVQARNLSWVGAIILMVTAYFMLVNIEKNFNAIWGIGQQRRGLYSFLLYWSVLSLSPILLGAGLAISSYITSLALFEALTEVSTSVGIHALWLSLFPLALTSLAFTLLYVAVPNCGVKVLHGFIGGVAVSLSFIVAKNMFALVMSVASYGMVYGTFAALPIFLLWIYICWVVILFGANLVRCIPVFRDSHVSCDVHKTVLMIALLHNLWEKHQVGDSLRVEELVKDDWPFRDVDIEECLMLLQDKQFIRGINDNEYILTRDLHALSLWDFMRSLPWALPRPAEMEKRLPEVIQAHMPAWQKWLERLEALEAQGQERFQQRLDDYFRRESL